MHACMYIHVHIQGVHVRLNDIFYPLHVCLYMRIYCMCMYAYMSFIPGEAAALYVHVYVRMCVIE